MGQILSVIDLVESGRLAVNATIAFQFLDVGLGPGSPSPRRDSSRILSCKVLFLMDILAVIRLPVDISIDSECLGGYADSIRIGLLIFSLSR